MPPTSAQPGIIAPLPTGDARSAAPRAAEDADAPSHGDRPTLTVPVPAVVRPAATPARPAAAPPRPMVRVATRPVRVVVPPEARRSHVGSEPPPAPAAKPAPEPSSMPVPAARPRRASWALLVGVACAALVGPRALARGPRATAASASIARAEVSSPVLAGPPPAPAPPASPTVDRRDPPDAFEQARARLDALIAATPADPIARGARAALLADLALHLETRATALEAGADAPGDEPSDPSSLRARAELARADALRDLDQAERDARSLADPTQRARVDRSLSRTRRVLDAGATAETDRATRREIHHARSRSTASEQPLTIYTSVPF